MSQPSLFDFGPQFKPQTQDVLALLRQRGSLSPLEALRLANCDRLAARVYELRKAGIDVARIWEENANGGRHARYYIRSAA